MTTRHIRTASIAIKLSLTQQLMCKLYSSEADKIYTHSLNYYLALHKIKSKAAMKQKQRTAHDWEESEPSISHRMYTKQNRFLDISIT